jgi:N-acetylneuraminate synthase
VALKKIIINNHVISDSSPVFMIAEIGVNHNGSLDIAKRLIDAAFACDWHSVKFQKRNPDLCVPEDQKKLFRETPWGKITYLDYRYKVEFGESQYAYIDNYCRQKPISWSASVWDIPSLEFILGYGVPFIKIPSAKLTEDDLLKIAAKSGKPVILSTGMSTLEEVDRAVEILEKSANGNYILLHTNSAYPAPANELNLRMIKFLRDRYDCLVGYSGHEYDLEPSVVAVSLGACVIERHITVDHKMWGSDQAASLEVHAMDLLHKRIKEVAGVLGDGIKKITPSELQSRKKLSGKSLIYDKER